MKTKFLIALCALAAISFSCSKEDSQFDEILASVEENHASFAGKTLSLEGYASKDVNEKGADYWIIDIGSYSETDNCSAHGVLQGTFVGKDVDLVEVNVDELLFTFTVFTSATETAKSSEYGFSLNKYEGKVESISGEGIWEKEYSAGSCFKSGKISSSVTKDGKIKVSVAATLKDGTAFALKINKTYEDRTLDY